MIRRLAGKPALRTAPSLDELLLSVNRGLSGTGGLLPEVSPVRSRLAGQIVDRPCLWFVPVMTTEASPRLAMCPYPVVVWDERYSHYLGRLAEAHEAWVRARPDRESATRAFAAIAWDFVIEQLCQTNSLPRGATDPLRARRVRARVFAHRVEARATDNEMLQGLIRSPAMTDPGVKELVRIRLQICRDLALDHEAHHYLRKHAHEWDARAPKSMAEMESHVLDLLSDFQNTVISGGRPSEPTWSFFETVLRQLPMSFLREEFEGTQKGEEVQSDLVPLMMFCNEGKDVGQEGTEAEEFKVITTCYQTGRFWQIASAFLQGLRIEVARSLGRGVGIRAFEDTDLGLRLMLGNFMSYKVLVDPPYSERLSRADDVHDCFMQRIEETRRLAKAYPRMMNEGPNGLARKHRVLFLDDYELSSHHWLQVLNAVGLEVADHMKAAAEPSGPVPPMPSFKRYLDFLGIPSSPGMAHPQ